MRAVAMAIAGLLVLPALASADDVPQLVRISPGNGAFGVGFRGATPDLGTVLCDTSEALTADDTDDSLDLYECAGAATTRVTVGEAGLGNENTTMEPNLQGVWISDDGSQVIFSTNEALEPGDTDNVAAGNVFPDGQWDVYKRAGGHTTRLSTGPGDNNGNIIADVLAVSADGNRALIQTNGGTLITEGFVKGVHLFIRDQAAGTTTRVNAQEIGDPAFFAGGNSDLSRVVWKSDAQEAGDTDDRLDLFQWAGGTITQLSPGPSNSTGFSQIAFGGASADGTRVVFETTEPLLAGDTDDRADVYAAQGGALSRLSVGPLGGNADRDARFLGASADGTHVFFSTSENLTADDLDTGGDEGSDVYESFGGALTLISRGSADADAVLGQGGSDGLRGSVSADGSRVILSTDERLVAADTDAQRDLYAVSGGVPALLTTGPSGGNGAFDADYLGGSTDMSVVVFSTAEKVTPDDLDARRDVYVRAPGGTSRLSGTPGSGNGAFDATVPAEFSRASGRVGLGAVSADGSRVVISTPERLTADDTDSQVDLFMSTRTPAAVTPTPTPTPTPTTAASPAPTPTASKPAPLPAITKLVVFPSTRRCVSRRKFGIRLRVPRGLKAVSATVFVNRKRVAVRRGDRLRSTVNLRGLPKGRVKVKITIELADGRRITGTRKYHTCVKARRKHRPPKV